MRYIQRISRSRFLHGFPKRLVAGTLFLATSNKFLLASTIIIIGIQQYFYVHVATQPPEVGDVYSSSGSVVSGSTVTVRADPKGYFFENWSCGSTVVSLTPAYSFAVNQNVDLTANFTAGVTASVFPDIGGSVVGAPVRSIAGETNSFLAVPTAGSRYIAKHEFVNWTEDGVEISRDPEYTFVSTAQGRHLVANFSPLPAYTVSTAVPKFYNGVISGGGGYYRGDVATLRATAYEGFDFTGWSCNGEFVTSENEVQFVVVTNTDWVANFSTTNEVALFNNGSPQRITVIRGTNVLLTCQSSEPSYSWFNSYPEFPDQFFHWLGVKRKGVKTGRSLVLTNVQPRDSGVYRLMLRDDWSRPKQKWRSSLIYLRVIKAPAAPSTVIH